MFAKGRWKYARYISTTRGMSERLFDQSAFPHAVLESQHFASLRSDALNTLPKSTAAVVAAVVASSPAAIAAPPLPYERPDAALLPSSGDLRAEDPIERGRSITQASALCNSASLPKSPSPLQRLAAVVASDRQAYRRHADVVVLHHTPTVTPAVVLYDTPPLSANPLHMLANAALADPEPHLVDQFHALAKARRPTGNPTSLANRHRAIAAAAYPDPSEASVAAARHLLTEIGRFRSLPPPRLTVTLAAAVGYQNTGNPTSLANRHRAIAAAAYHALFLNIYGRTLDVTPPRFASSHGYAAALLRRWMRILHKPLLAALEHDL